MAALTQDRITKTRRVTGIITERLPIATSSRIYKGALVNRRNTTGRALAAATGSGRRIAGLAREFTGGTTNTGLGNTAGTEYVTVERNILALVNVRTAIRTNTSLGLNVFISDDNTVGGTAAGGTAGARVVAGTLLSFEASNKSTGWLLVGGILGTVSIAV